MDRTKNDVQGVQKAIMEVLLSIEQDFVSGSLTTSFHFLCRRLLVKNLGQQFMFCGIALFHRDLVNFYGPRSSVR